MPRIVPASIPLLAALLMAAGCATPPPACSGPLSVFAVSRPLPVVRTAALTALGADGASVRTEADDRFVTRVAPGGPWLPVELRAQKRELRMHGQDVVQEDTIISIGCPTGRWGGDADAAADRIAARILTAVRAGRPAPTAP